MLLTLCPIIVQNRVRHEDKHSLTGKKKNQNRTMRESPSCVINLVGKGIKKILSGGFVLIGNDGAIYF